MLTLGVVAMYTPVFSRFHRLPTYACISSWVYIRTCAYTRKTQVNKDMIIMDMTITDIYGHHVIVRYSMYVLHVVAIVQETHHLI